MSEEIKYPSEERERAKSYIRVSAEVRTYLHDLYNQIQYEFCEQYEDEIKHLQQKVEQLEKENQKFFEELNTCMIERNSFLDKVEQLEKENNRLKALKEE